MTTPASSVADALRKMSATGKSAELRSRRLLDIGQVVDVRTERGGTGERPGFFATVRLPFHWTANDGRIRWGMVPDVHISAPVAIGDMVVLETIGRGFEAIYIGSPAVQPMPLHVSGAVANPNIQLAAQGPGGAVQWYRKLGSFAVRGESTAFVASATFAGLAQAAPAMTSKLPATVTVDVDDAAGPGSHSHTATADLAALNTVLESGILHSGSVPFSVRLAALGPYDGGTPVGPGDTGAAWVLGEAGAGDTGAVVDPGHISVAGNPDLAVSFDAAFDVGADGAGRRYDLYLLITAGSAATYTATSLRLNVLEAAWNTDYAPWTG